MGADFEIEETEHYTESTGTALDHEPRDVSSRVKFSDDVKNYSKEVTYSPARRLERENAREIEPENDNLLNNRK